MFEELRRAWHKATDPFEGFLEVLWEVWKKDVARATLMARHSWRDIPQETVQKSLAMQAQTMPPTRHTKPTGRSTSNFQSTSACWEFLQGRASAQAACSHRPSIQTSSFS